MTKALERLTGVLKARVSHEKGEARVTFDPDRVKVEGLIAAVANAGPYTARAA